MRFIHGFDRINSAFLITLLIVTQSLAPLIHGHGGYDEPIRGFHMPGFEQLSRIAGPTDIGSHGFQYSGLELIISVASGIETKDLDDPGFDAKDLFAAALEGIKGSTIFTGPSSGALHPSPPIHRSWAHQPSRAPPHALA